MPLSVPLEIFRKVLRIDVAVLKGRLPVPVQVRAAAVAETENLHKTWQISALKWGRAVGSLFGSPYNK